MIQTIPSCDIMVKLATDPRTAIELLPWYVEVDQTRKEICEEVYARMLNDPNRIMVVLLFAYDLLCGFGIGKVEGEDLFLWQGHTDSHVPRSVVDETIGRIMNWGKAMGCNRILTVPNRNLKLWRRRWGFVPISDRIVAKEI
jgi:hypothetical protein